jgi:hypothetical protein
MADAFRQVRRSVITTFSNVLRTSALKEHNISQQQLALLLDRQMTEAGEAGPLDLGPVYDHLRKLQIDDEACLEALLAFKDREEQLGYPLQLPTAVEHLPRDKRQRLLMRYQKRQRGARARTAVPAADDKGAPSAAAAPVARSGRGGGPRPAFIIFMLISLLIGGGVLYYRQKTAPPPQVDVVIDSSSALPCEKLTGSDGNLVCRLPGGERDSMSDSDFVEAAEATMTAGQGLGYTRLIVIDAASGRLLGQF